MTWLVTLLLACVPQASPQEIDAWVGTLDSGDEPAWTRALEGLARAGAPAVTRALEGFEALDFRARRARAALLERVPATDCVSRVLALLADPDPLVRFRLVRWLGNPALAEAEAAARVAALEGLALADDDPRVRARARQGLSECALEEAVPALDRLIDRTSVSEAEAAAKALAELPLGRQRLIARLAGAPAGAGPAPVWAALLGGYGRALAEVPGGGEALRERLPLLRGRIAPEAEVREAARGALATFVSRAAELSESVRAERVLEALGEEGWPRVETLRRRLDLAWLERGDPEHALDLAWELERAAQALEADEAEAWELRATLFRGAAWTALERGDEARACFDALVPRLEGLLERRTDLYPGPRAERWTEGGGTATIDHLHLLALAHLWRGLLALERDPADAAVARELRAAHVCFLQSRLVAQRTGAPDPSTLDSLLDRDLSPYTLLFFNQRLEAQGRGPGLDAAVALGAVWGRVAPLEMIGLGEETPSDRALGDVFFDRERRALLLEMRQAERRDLQLQQDELLNAPGLGPSDPDARENRRVIVRSRYLMLSRAENDERERLGNRDPGELSSAELRSVYAQLLEYLSTSMHAWTLAQNLCEEGRSTEGRILCERALETLRTAPVGVSSVWNELSSARFGTLRGSALMDEGRPQEAEQAFLEADRRLAAIEVRVQEWLQSAPDVEAAGQTLAQIRTQRGSVLLSLAVNANVRLRDPARALEYFERAYELNQSPFMRVLRACYRARSGKAEEARTVLAGVVPVPSLYYNIACTHALLGEKDAALDYLERDFRENAPTPGSRTQKREWARKDPDLASLRDEPRFQRLLEGS